MAKEKKHTRPSEPTVKRLFNLYRHCSYPGCRIKAVDDHTNSILLEVAHIRAEREGAARYDTSQTDEARHAFENLTLLCAMHHKIIDDHEDLFPVDALEDMKAAGEACPPDEPPPANVAHQALLILNLGRPHSTLSPAPANPTAAPAGLYEYRGQHLPPLPPPLTREDADHLVEANDWALALMEIHRRDRHIDELVWIGTWRESREERKRLRPSCAPTARDS